MDKGGALFLMAMIGLLGLLGAWMALWPLSGKDKPSRRLIAFMVVWAALWLSPPLFHIWIAGMLG